jgi:hypothetical protein
MPAIQTYYANQEEYLLDKARENPFFDEKSYESGGFDYLATLELATYGENKNVDFNTYNILPSDQKMNYLAYSLGYVDDPNITGDYFNAVAEDYQKQLEWDNKNWFEKLGESVSTTIKSAATEVYGIVEGFVDTLAQVGASIGELVGADVSGIKEFIASDFSGVGEFRQQIQEEVRYNKWINQGFGKYVFDAFTSLGSMSALTLNLIAPGLGTGVYYSNVFGKSAEEVYNTRGTSISSWEATSYAGLQTGAEYIGEKIFSSKFLGGMINTSAWKAKSRVINIALSALEEGTEEIVTEALNYATNSLYSSVVSSDYEQFLPENGLGRAMLDSFITGALMGGITTGVGSVLTKRITLPNGVKLNKNQSYLWKELSEDIKEASVKNSALYDLRLKKGTNYTQAEYDAAYKKDVKTMKAAARALKVVGGLETTFGTSNISEIKSNLTQETYLRDARNAVRNYWIEYSNPEYKRLIDNTSAEYNKYAEEFNSKNKNTRLTVVNETSEEFQLIESAFSGIGKRVIPVKVGNSSGAVGQVFIEGSSVGQSGVIYINVDKLGRLSPDQILEKSIAEYGVNLLAKNNSIINDSAIKELFDRPSGKELTQAEKNLIAYNLLSNPKTISAVVGCNKRLAKKIIDNLKNRLKIESGKTKYSKITINQLNKTLLLYKYQLATNAGTKEGVAYYSKEYDLDEVEMLKIFNSLNEYDFQQHYVSEKLDVSVTSKTRTDALNLLNNARLTSEIQNENVISDYSELLNENIYKPDFVKQIKQDSQYENFAYALNNMLYNNFGLYINSNTGTFEVARNVVREIDPEFRLKMDEYSNRLYNLKQSKLSDSEYTNELNNIVNEINSNKYTIRDFYNGAFLKHIKLDKNTPIIFEINDNVSYDASYNPATDIVRVYINSFDYKPGVGSIKGLNSELNDVKSNIYNSIIHESVHILAEAKNSYFGTNIRGIVGFFNTEKGNIIYNKLKKLLESRLGSLDKSMMANLVYNLTYGEMEASRYSKSTPTWIRSFMETIGYSPELGTAMVSDGFLATKDGKLIGKGKFLGIIIDLTDSTYAAHEVSFDALSEEGVSKESKETEESQISIDNTEDIIDKEIRLKELIKNYSSNKNRTKEAYIEIGRLSDELGIDLPGYNYETYDRLVAEQKETEQKSEYKIVKKETLSDEEKFNNYKSRVALIRELAKQNNTEELSKLQNRYEKNDKRLLINEMGKELYDKLISEFNKLEGVSTKSALNEQALNVRKSIEKHIDKLTPENKAIFEELRYKWGGKGETKKMSQEDVENRLKTLEKIRNQFKTKPYNQKEEGRKIFVNESGKYNTFYKGASISGITEFDNTKGDKKRIVEGAIYLTDSRDVALTYTQSDDGAVYSVNIKATNPYIIDAKGRTFEKIIADKSTDNFVLDIKQRGYDSVIIKNVVDIGARYVGNTAEARKPHTDIVVFNKNDVEIISSEQAKPEVKKETVNDFTRIQNTSRKELNEKSWRERVESVDEALRQRFSRAFKEELKSRGYSNEYNNGILELEYEGNSYKIYKNVDGQTFHDIFEIVRLYTENGELVDLHGVDDGSEHGIGYSNTENYLSEDGTAGFALTPGGDLISVFNLKASIKKNWLRMILPTIKEKAKTLDCYISPNQNLQEMYSKIFGFKTASIMDWNSEFDHDNIGENHNNPKVAFMVNTEKTVETKYFDKTDYDGAQAYQLSFIEQKTEKPVEKSETRGVFDKSDEQILVHKKQLSSQISDIMTNLSDTTYRNEGAFEGDLRAGTKASKSKMGQGSEYAIASQALFFEKKSDWLSAINKKNASEILSQLKTIDINALNKRFILNYLWINRYKLNKSQISELNSMIEVENTRVGQEMVAIKNALEEDSPISALASDIKTEYGVSIKVSYDVVGKYIPEVKELGWEKALEKTTQEIDDLKKKLSETEDALSKYDLEEQMKDKQKLANLLAEQDGVGLMSYAYDKLLNPNYDYTEGKIKASELSNEILQIMIEQTEGLKKLMTPKKDGKPGSMFSPQTQEKILNFFNKARSFRYLCMLSSFSTAARNALTNTAIGINKIVEDQIGKGLEKVVMKNAPESQVSYYGDYDKAFSDFIDDTYEEYVRSRSGTDTKWKQTEGGEIKKQFTQEKNKFKLAPLNWFAKTERKLLSDAPWTVRRTLKNFKSMISGALPQLKVDVYNILAAKYNVNSQEALLNKLKSGNKEAYDQYVAMTNDDLIATTKLAMRLQVPLLEQVLRKAEYRADRLYFRTDNPISRGLDNLRKSHPIVHDIISFFIPFGKVMYNTTAYAVEHSPIGLAMGVVKQLQTRNSWVSDMRHEIQTYVNSLYYTQTNKTDYNSEEYNNWVSKNISEELKNVLSGSNKNAADIYNKLVDEGKILSGTIGLNNPFAKADVIELYSKGAIGTAYLVLGIVLALTGAFKIDDDDYMGLILKIGNVKIRLSDLAPFSTAFSFGAALIGASEGKFGTGLKNALSTFYDQTMLGTVESIIGYNDSITNILQYQGIQALQQYVPSILKQFTKVIDPHAKKKSGNFWDKLWQTTASNIPGLSYLVPNKVDPYTGESEQRYSTGAIGELIHIFNPLKIVVEKKSDLELEAERVGAMTTGTSGTFSINGTKYTLYGKELETYSKIRADYVKNEMNKLINSLYYKRLSKEEQSKEIKKIYDAAGEIMKINYWLNSGHSSYVFTDYSKMNDYSNYIESSKIQYRKKWNKSKYID